MDWYQRGKSDALSGKTAKAYAEDDKICRKNGITLHSETYIQGRADGLRKLCTEDGGERFGRDGGTYLKTCPPSLEAEFLKGYKIGQREFELAEKQKALEEKEQKLHAEERALSNLHGKPCDFDSDCAEEGGHCVSTTACDAGDCVDAHVCRH